jgi:hypothetical protein
VWKDWKLPTGTKSSPPLAHLLMQAVDLRGQEVDDDNL